MFVSGDSCLCSSTAIQTISLRRQCLHAVEQSRQLPVLWQHQVNWLVSRWLVRRHWNRRWQTRVPSVGFAFFLLARHSSSRRKTKGQTMTDEFCSWRKPVSLRISLAVKFINPILLFFNDSLLIDSLPLCDFRTPDGSIDFLLTAIPQFGNVRFMLLFQGAFSAPSFAIFVWSLASTSSFDASSFLALAKSPLPHFAIWDLSLREIAGCFFIANFAIQTQRPYDNRPKRGPRPNEADIQL